MDYKERRIEYNRKSFKKYLKNNLPKVCCNCGSDIDIQYHHIVPLRLGGTNKVTNIVPLCRICHSVAHGSINIRKICMPNETGRKKVQPPEDYEEILWDYLKGEIGKSECQRLLNITGKSKLTDKWYFKEFLKKEHIKHYRNNVDTFNQDRLKGCKGVRTILAKIVYENGVEYVKKREIESV